MRSLRPSSTVLMKRRQRLRRRRQRPRYVRVGMQTGLALAVMASAFLLGSGGLLASAGFRIYANYAQQLPDIESLTVWDQEFQTVSIYDRTGEHLLLLSLDPRPFSGDRTYIALQNMSPWIWKAALALEDRSFWTNPGISVRGISRAFVSNLRGGAVQGGSSITQQLIKNIAIPFEQRAQRSYARKIREMILSMELTRKYEKEQILEWYLNFNFYGNLAYGVEAASRIYFGKSSAELTLAEAAMLAPIPQFQAMNPFYLPERAKERQRIALDSMAEAGYITQAQADAAFAEELIYATGVSDRFDFRLAPHFGLYVLNQLQAEFNTTEDPYFIWKNGLTVRTTLDLDLQGFAENAARTHIRSLQATGRDASNASVVAIEPATGAILALVGSINYEDRAIDGQVNVALAHRQPGSSFKPYVYIAGLEQGMTAADMLLDVRTPFRLDNGSIYVPENFDREYHGPVSLRTALARSYNIPSIKVMEAVGVGDAIRVAQRLGINSLDRGTQFYGLSLVLGGGEVSLLDHTYAYSVLGNGGVMAGQRASTQTRQGGFRPLNPVSILEVADAEGQILRQYDATQRETVLDPKIHYIVSDILSDDRARAAAFGWNSPLTLADRRVAAKTGTTNNIRDTWTLGYTPQLAVGVWVGNTDNRPMRNLSGLTGAAPIWNQMMRKYHETRQPAWYPRPPGVIQARVCAPSGLQVTPQCPQSRHRQEWFVEGTQPKAPDNVWQAFTLDAATGRLATSATAPANRRTEHFQILPLEAQDWIKETNFPQPPTPAATTASVNFAQTMGLSSPAAASYVRANVDVRGFVRDPAARSWRLEIMPADQSAPPLELASGQGRTESEHLTTLSTTSFPDGHYALRLLAQQDDGFLDQVSSPLFIDNTVPTVELTEPEANQIFVLGDDEQVNMHAEVADAAVERVEFWFDDEPLTTSTVSPYNERWRLSLRDLSPARFAQPAVVGVKQLTEPQTGQVLGEIPEVEEITRDWLPDFEAEDLELTRGRIRDFANGFAAILTADGLYLERHQIQIRVFDRAGNEARTPIVRIYVRRPDAGP